VEAKEYLGIALGWLREEQRRSSWNWQVHDMLPKIREALRQIE
jgi:hypothetical protein